MQPYYQDGSITLYHGNALDVLRELPAASAHCCVTSPPYWGLRDYGIPPSVWPDGWTGCHGLEPTIEMYVEHEVLIFRELRRVLRDDGTLWLNLGDTYMGSWGNYHPNGKGGQRNKDTERFEREAYADTTFRPPSSYVSKPSFRRDRKEREDDPHKSAPGLKSKDLAGIPWRVALALQADGWYLRCDIIWHKPNPMPESVRDRPTKSHEYIFLLTKSQRYYFDQEAIKEPASYNTHERQARAKESHKSAPDNFKNGIRTPKANRVPSGWDTGPGSHDKLDGRYPQIKNNPSFDKAMAIMPEKRNKRSVWTVPTFANPEAHFATFPPDLIKPCILAGCPKGEPVIDPFSGSGTTAYVAKELGRKAIGIDINVEYLEMNKRRIIQEVLPL